LLAQAPAHSFLDHHPTGASTGYMEDLRGSWDRLVEEACAVSSFAVELAALGEDELDGLMEFLARHPSLSFRYLSVHAPVKGRRITEAELVARLSELPRSVDAIVVHPDLIQEPSLYRPLGRRLAIENMDDRKPTGQVAAELEPLFEELPDAGFCFDIAHAWSVDPSMAAGEELLDRLRCRLRHLHVSSLVNGEHASLTAEHERLFAPLLRRCVDVPWILEAPPPQH
jgi:hypothetical protein